MKDLFNGKPVKLEGESDRLAMSRVELVEFLDAIRDYSGILVTYDKDEEEWKETQKQVNAIREIHKDYDDIVAFDPYRSEKKAEIATVFSDENYQKNKEEDLVVHELEKMFQDNDKVTVFDKSRRRK